MQTKYEIKEAKDSVWGVALTLAMFTCIAFCYNNGILIRIQLITSLIVLFVGIKTYLLCVCSTSFFIENEVLTIQNKHRRRSIPLEAITAIIIIENQTLIQTALRFRSSHYHARLCTKSATYRFDSIRAPAFVRLPYNMETEEEKFLSLFKNISQKAKISIKGSGDFDNIFMKDLKYFNDYIFLIIVFFVAIVLSVKVIL